MLKQTANPSGRKAANGAAATIGVGGSPVSAVGVNSTNSRPVAGRGRNSGKGPPQSSPMFEGVYNNSRMLHFLTAVVGSTCDIRVKNGSIYEGIFKTLSSKCELAVDAVHKKSLDQISGGTPPKREEIIDTMIFKPSDLVTMHFKNVDLNYATKDKFTDSAISSSKVNGEHKEKVLQRWEGGDSNGESYDLDSDTANGWDPNEMFRYNEENYGIKSTYDASLSLYTVPLEKGNSEQYRQREARAEKLASEIEASPQYRQRISMENDEGRSEEDKYSSVVRERDRDSPREKERDRDSPSFSSREGKYIPLPQRARESGSMRGAPRGSSSSGAVVGSQTQRGSLSSSGPRTVGVVSSLPPRSTANQSTEVNQSQSRSSSALLDAGSPSLRSSYHNHHHGSSVTSERGSPQTHHSESSRGHTSGFHHVSHHPEQRNSLHSPRSHSNSESRAASTSVEPSSSSPVAGSRIITTEVCANTLSGSSPRNHVAGESNLPSTTSPVPGSSSSGGGQTQRSTSSASPADISAPQAMGPQRYSSVVESSSQTCGGSNTVVEPQRVVNGVSGASRMSPKSQRIIPASRTIKPNPSPTATTTSGTSRTSFTPRSPKSCSGSQEALLTTPYLDNSAISTAINKLSSPVPSFPIDVNEFLGTGAKERAVENQSTVSEVTKACAKVSTEHQRNQIEELRKFGKEFRLQPSTGTVEPEPPVKDVDTGTVDGKLKREGCPVADADKLQQVPQTESQVEPVAVADRQSPGTSSPARTPSESDERPEGMSEQVKKSTLNPNAKEFNPTKPIVTAAKPTNTPTPPRPQTLPSPSITVLPPPNQSGLYNPQYISYVSQIHMSPAVQGPQMYQYTVSAVSQGKYPRAKSSVGPQRSDQHHAASAPPMMQAATAAGPPLVAAAPYPSSYIQYNPQQAVMQAMAHYQSQPVYPMIQGNPRMMSGAHPQTIVSSSAPQYPSADQGPPQTMYATVPQPYPHHSNPMHPHQPQPASTPTGNQQAGQHPAPSPVQHQSGLGSGQPPQQGLYHAGALTPTPPAITPGPNPQSPQSGYTQQQVYAIHAHQQIQHGYGLGQIAQAHVQGGLPGGHPHPSSSHGPPQVMLLHAPPQQSHGGPPSHPNHPGQGGQQSGAHYTYIGHPQAVPVQPHHASQQISFHPPAN
ncbi:LOW QUALITY PROTEIN: ataxin-2-like [Erpetoichthys calabaricus]|uniref:LOW QUALITY PROTEIN: ataxin-2-like n=1 Tax=Erpetoichthys calabaricus TaxID=27687 RepID=UPI00223425DA|nr:LOW QUALITY PROTEIN: ataxin-2-like [Erpetoichthys calabaricus]